MGKEYSQLVKSAANLAIIVAVFLIIIKAFAWWETGSISILAAMTDSVVDLFASLTNILIIRFALQPADDNHAFGHGKAESLAALAQSAFISGSAVFILLQGFHKLTNPELLIQSNIGVVVSIISIVVTAFLVLYQRYVIKITQSPAIEADSLHYQTDLFMNATILIAILLNRAGYLYADALFAIGIALYIAFNAAKMFWCAIQSLLDQALPDEEIELIKEIASQHSNILGIHDILTRRAGAVRFIQLHLELDDNLTLLVAHEITDSLEQKLLSAFPMSKIIIHQEPTTVVKEEFKDMVENI